MGSALAGEIVGDRTMASVLDAIAADFGDKIMIDGVDEIRLTYSSVARCARSIACQLLASGLSSGGRVAFLAPISHETVLLQYALYYAGLVGVPINPSFTSEEVRRAVTQFECDAIIVSAPGSGAGKSIVATDLAVDILWIEWPQRDQLLLGDLSGSTVVSEGHHFLENAEGALPRVTPSDPATIYQTSGTTGSSKGVVLSHGNLVHAAEVVSKHYALRDDDIYFGHFPLFHVNGAALQLNPTVLTGGKFYLAGNFSGTNFADRIAHSHATLTHLNAVHVRILLLRKRSRAEAENNLRLIPAGLSPTNEELAEFESRFDVRLVQHYGLTESTGIISADGLIGARKLGSIGRPCLEYIVRIVDSAGIPMLPAATGEIEIESLSPYGLMVGYYGDPEGTEAVLRNGRLRTGDLGRLDEDGVLWYEGREKDAIKRGGETIAPVEIEVVLAAHPCIKEAAVVGAPDEIMGEVVSAYIVLADGANFMRDSIIEHCRQELAPFKIPRDLTVLPELPRNEIGKIDKKRLRTGAFITQADA